jgi:hypothetical protein
LLVTERDFRPTIYPIVMDGNSLCRWMGLNGFRPMWWMAKRCAGGWVWMDSVPCSYWTVLCFYGQALVVPLVWWVLWDEQFLFLDKRWECVRGSTRRMYSTLGTAVVIFGSRMTSRPIENNAQTREMMGFVLMKGDRFLRL